MQKRMLPTIGDQLSFPVQIKDSGAYMERRTFGVRKVSIQQGHHKSYSLNNELWKHQVNPGQH
jgi:hypothetical protein